MIEVLVTIAIVIIGVWGLLDLQSRLQKSEMESYQRTQALILLNDMASRIKVNRNSAASYAMADPTADFLGNGMDCDGIPMGTPPTVQQTDYFEWCEALQGAAETSSGAGVGAMVRGRGCVEDLGSDQYLISVVWQGLTPVSAPPLNLDCGLDAANAYDGPAGSDCVNDLCRRYVTTIVRIGNLL